MQPVEALTRLIALSDGMTAAPGSPLREAQFSEHDQEKNQLAIGVCQAMLNTALPVARFRVFVKIESGKNKDREFTVCAVKIEDVVAALHPLSLIGVKVYVTLWEQRATGADMLEGYQGYTKIAGSRGMKLYLDGLSRKYGQGVN